mmetsp:Transcript_15941/g.25464  ORF Transcript_15941/g.25464 Transcript_15941/m.25464 type:complete len:219 (-) Transcript_15941:1447-2103(-)
MSSCEGFMPAFRERGPTTSDRPPTATMSVAMRVAMSMSERAPIVASPSPVSSSSAARPPIATASSAISTRRDSGSRLPSSGSANCVTPPVPPAGTILMCATVRNPPKPCAPNEARMASFTTACPASCEAVSSISAADGCRPEGTPVKDLLYAACTCRSPTPRAPSRAAAIAASFTRPARSAPEKPGVRFAHPIQSTGAPASAPVSLRLLGSSRAKRCA